MAATDQSPTVLARRYLRDQFAVMRKHGSGHVHLTRADYWALVRTVRRPIEQARRRQR
jgi:hypothetical protein